MDISVHALIAVRADIFSVPYLDEFVHLPAMRTELRGRDSPVEDNNINLSFVFQKFLYSTHNRMPHLLSVTALLPRLKVLILHHDFLVMQFEVVNELLCEFVFDISHLRVRLPEFLIQFEPVVRVIHAA